MPVLHIYSTKSIYIAQNKIFFIRKDTEYYRNVPCNNVNFIRKNCSLLASNGILFRGHTHIGNSYTMVLIKLKKILTSK